MGEWPHLMEIAGVDNNFGRGGGDGKFVDQIEGAWQVEGKVHSLALKKIVKKSLYRNVSISSPKLIARLFPQFFMLRDKVSKKPEGKKKLKVWEFKKTVFRDERKIIGIVGNGHNNWINALMQFLIFVPELRALFDLLPKEFEVLKLFSEAYLREAKSGQEVFSYDSDVVMKCLYRQFGEKILLINQSAFNLYDVLELLLGRIDKKNILKDSLLNPLTHVLCRRPDQTADMQKYLENHFYNIAHQDRSLDDLFFFPKNLLITCSWCFSKNSINKKRERAVAGMRYFFASRKELAICYELDAFIVYRQQTDRYATYVKTNIGWSFAEDEEVRKVDFPCEKPDIVDGFLFHYNFLKIKKPVRIT